MTFSTYDSWVLAMAVVAEAKKDALGKDPDKREAALRWMRDPAFSEAWFHAAKVNRQWMLDQVTRKAA